VIHKEFTEFRGYIIQVILNKNKFLSTWIRFIKVRESRQFESKIKTYETIRWLMKNYNVKLKYVLFNTEMLQNC
jgi:hypothetical protein